MEFNVKKIVKDAGAAISRAVQLAEEKFGSSEKTELDAHFENLWERAEATKIWTEKLVNNTEAVLVPNPGNRIEDVIYEKIEKKKPARLSNLEYLGLDMIESGNVYGPGTAYGSTLIKVGLCEQRLGQAERDYVGSAGICLIQPLKKFLEGEMKTILKEKSILETKRLDLDACKTRVRKARSLLGQPTAERDLRIAQSEFDRQAEITKLLLESVSNSHLAHLRSLNEFVETQARYYAHCSSVMTELQQELSSYPKHEDHNRQCAGSNNIDAHVKIATMANSEVISNKKARVMNDYRSPKVGELAVTRNEIINFVAIEGDDVFVLGKRADECGKVRKDNLQVLLLS